LSSEEQQALVAKAFDGCDLSWWRQVVTLMPEFQRAEVEAKKTYINDRNCVAW
jgi:hypothetical protein